MNNSQEPKAKEQVLAWVRSKNPQTMELRFGCVFKFKDGFITPSDGAEIPKEYCNRPFMVMSHNIRGNSPLQTSDLRTTQLCFCCPYSKSEAISLTVGTEIGMKYFKENLEILGSDMGLQEVFHAMVQMERWDTITSKYKSALAKIVSLYNFEENLHNQEEFFYEALLPLINE